MNHNYRETDEDCQGCGSTAAYRLLFAAGADDVPLGVSNCPHCGAEKCSMCDMGDDVECGNCDGEGQ